MRFYSLDFARSTLMLYGIVYHSAFVFSSYHWRVNSIESNIFFNYIVEFSQLFRMHAFFTISGFFSAMMILKYGNRQFVKTRLIRLGIPLVFCGLTFNSVMNIVTYNLGHWYDSFPWILSWPYWLGGEWIAHLWFLINLIVYAIFFAVISTRFNKIIGGFKISYFIILIALPVIAYISPRVGWRIPHIFNTENYILISLFSYFPYFLLGYLLFFNKKIIDELSRYKYINITLLGLTYIVSEGYLMELKLLFIVEILNNLKTLLIIFFIIHISSVYFNKDSKIIKSISDSSFTIYLLHMPLIVFISPYFFLYNINIFLKYIIMLVLVFTFTYLIHQFVVVKNRYLSLLINGNSTLVERKKM